MLDLLPARQYNTLVLSDTRPPGRNDQASGSHYVESYYKPFNT